MAKTELAVIDKAQRPVDFVQSKLDETGSVTIDEFATYVNEDLDKNRKHVHLLMQRTADKIVNCKLIRGRGNKPTRIVTSDDVAASVQERLQDTIQIPIIDERGNVTNIKIQMSGKITRESLLDLAHILNSMCEQ